MNAIWQFSVNKLNKSIK